MQNSPLLGRSRFTNVRLPSRATALVIVAVIGVWGCGSASIPTPAPTTPTSNPTPVASDASVNGQYNLVLTSTNGQGTTNIYTNFTQTGKTFAGAANTLVCPSNEVSQCKGGDSSVVSITPSGTVSGANVSMLIPIPGSAGTNTFTMVGATTGTRTNLTGTYTDSSGDAGTWTASTAIYGFGTGGAGYYYSRTFNSTSNPLMIAPTISIELLGQGTGFDVTGSATIMNSPCISSLNLSGQAIGDALRVTDATNKAFILALPTQPTLKTGNSFNFSYQFEPTAPNCAGDIGRGTLTLTAAVGWWDY
jgi:hypothetical protein